MKRMPLTVQEIDDIREELRAFLAERGMTATDLSEAIGYPGLVEKFLAAHPGAGPLIAATMVVWMEAIKHPNRWQDAWVGGRTPWYSLASAAHHGPLRRTFDPPNWR